MKNSRRNLQSLVSLFLISALVLGAACAVKADPPAQKAWRPPDPLELKDREIRLLKQQLGQARQQLEVDHIGRIVYETQLRVAALHGFAVKGVVTYAPLTNAVVDRLIADSIKTQYPGRTLDDFVWLNQLFAALPQPFDMAGTYRGLMDEQAAGIYDPHSKKLFVKTDFPLETTLGQMILSHEICHSFQDQNFSLIDMGSEDVDNGDLAMATLSIAEGDATLLMSEYFAKYGNPADIIGLLPNLLSMDQQKMEFAPPSIQETLLFPYLNGMRFFQTLGGRTRRNPLTRQNPGDPTWRNGIFQDPPTTTAQILHPELYLSKKLPASIDAPVITQAGPATVNVAGEFGIVLLLEPLLGSDRAEAAAAGWNGDKIAVADAADGRRRLVRWVTRWDTAKDADEFAAALEDVLAARYPGALSWHGGHAARQAAPPTAELKILRSGRDGVEFQGGFDKGQAFPKVALKPSKRPTLGF